MSADAEESNAKAAHIIATIFIMLPIICMVFACAYKVIDRLIIIRRQGDRIDCNIFWVVFCSCGYFN